MREMLNRIDFAEGGERLSVWNWLRVIYSRHKDNPGFDFQTFRDFMGAEIDSQFSGNAFKYTIHIEEEENSIDIEDIISLGCVLLKIHIIKERTDGVGQPQTFELHGGLGQLSGGLSADWGIYEGGTGDDDITVYSNIDYTANMLAGPFGYFGATMAVGIGIIDVSYGPAMLNLYGDGTAPAFTIPLPVLDSDQHWVAPSVELGAGFGSLSAWDEMSPGALSLSSEPEDMSFTDEASAAGAVQFDVDSAELRRCGYANLRMLVAEMRPVFENENSTVSILGFTDATADDAHNLALSQARAETAKAALLALVGEGLAIPPENIRAIGLGRRPAMGGTSPNENQLNSLEKEFLARKKAALPVLSDGEANPDWRSVTLILNNLVTIDLKTP
jgi:outer membrane protein OmpA-like peptidoglycan-associated protein